MVKKFFLRRNGVILGPFAEDRLRGMLRTGELAVSDELSADKIRWRSTAEELAMIYPDLPPMPAPDTDPEQTPDAGPINPHPGSPADTAANLQPPSLSMCVETAGSRGWLGGEAISLLWNSSDCWLRLRRRGGNAMLGAGLLAMLLSLILAALGTALFAARYNAPPVVTWLRSMSFVLVAGLLLWLENVIVRMVAARSPDAGSAEADFLSAMQGMLNFAALHVLTLGTLFLCNPVLYRMAPGQLLAAATVLSLLWSFFLANILVGMRLNLICNVNLASCHATWVAALEVWSVFPVYGLLLAGIYKLNTGVLIS